MPDRTSRALVAPNQMLRHLHFGLGALSVGLVLGLIRRDAPLVIAQRKTGSWRSKDKELRKLCEVGTVSLRNYVEFDRVVNVYDAAQLTSDVKRKIASGTTTSSSLLFYSQLSELDWLMNKVGSVSTAVGSGQQEVSRWLDTFNGPPLAVFPFENTISFTSCKHRVLNVIPDRICPGVTVNSQEISTRAEESAEVVVNASDVEWSQAFRSNANVRVIVVEEKELYNYYWLRKRRLVNGLHYDLTTFGYRQLAKREIPVKHWKTQYLPIVIDSLLAEESEIHNYVKTLVGAQAMRLAIEAGGLPNSLKHRVFGDKNSEQLFLSLCEYGDKSINRFRNATDLLTRVLDLENIESMDKKFREHVKQLNLFVSNHGEDIESFPARLRPWRADIDYVITMLTEAENEVWAALLSEERRQQFRAS
jgi:hypothetical protein